MQKKSPDVSIILVGLNACRYIIECIESIHKAEWRNYSYEIIYVDNGSTDNSVDAVQTTYPETKLIVNDRNLGYCKAANQGVAISSGAYYMFQNDDTLLIDDALPLLVDFMEKVPDAGVVGSRLVYPDGTEQWSGRKFPSPLNGLLGRNSWLTRRFPNSAVVRKYLCKDEVFGSSEAFGVDWVSAAAMLVRKSDYHLVGGLAEDYYYWHEAVFSHRLLKQGKKTYLHPKSRIIHYEGMGSGPRPFARKKFHILDFHKGALRFFGEQHDLGPLSPIRAAVAIALYARASMLLMSAWLTSPRDNR